MVTSVSSSTPSASVPTPPRAARRSLLRNHHGDVFDDPYDWLRAKEDPAVIAHLEAENAYTDARLAHLAPLRETLFEEIKARVQESDLSVPTRRGDWWYYGRTVEGQQYGLQCRAAVSSPDDWTPPVLDGAARCRANRSSSTATPRPSGHEFFAMGAFDVSDDATRLLWSTDFEGDERYTVHVRDLGTSETLADEIPGTSGAFYTPDGASILYTTVDESWRPDTPWVHRIGTPVSDDVQLFHEPDERFWLGAGITRSRRFLVIGVGSSITSEEHLVDLDDLTAPPRVVWPRKEGVEYSVEHAVVDGRDELLVLHNDGALDFELVSVSVGPGRPAPHDPAAHAGTAAAGRRRVPRRHGRRLPPRGAGADRAAGSGDRSARRARASTSRCTPWARRQPRVAAPILRLGYGSFVTPSTVYDLELATGELQLRKRQPVLGGYDPADYDQRRDWAPRRTAPGSRSRSSGSAPSATRAGARPVHLYGYGSIRALHRSRLLGDAAVRAGPRVVFAVAHVRGGGEMGRQWYEDGKLERKRTRSPTSSACARHLIDEGITAPDRLVAEGGSAGGLLMGAVANLAPELFGGILAAVPFVDALTTILDPDLPLTVIEWDEWGDPLHDAGCTRT